MYSLTRVVYAASGGEYTLKLFKQIRKLHTLGPRIGGRNGNKSNTLPDERKKVGDANIPA